MCILVWTKKLILDDSGASRREGGSVTRFLGGSVIVVWHGNYVTYRYQYRVYCEGPSVVLIDTTLTGRELCYRV